MKPVNEVNIYTYDIKTLKENSNRKFAKYQEPYIKEVYDADGNLIEAEMIGYDFVRDWLYCYCEQLRTVILPSDITTIDEFAFSNCSNLTLTNLPSNLVSIGKAAFLNCFNLGPSIKIPSSVINIGEQAFYKCTGLTEVIFEGTPKSISNDVFTYSTNIATINVPWAEGAVANAPWGATNATINYNYTE